MIVHAGSNPGYNNPEKQGKRWALLYCAHALMLRTFRIGNKFLVFWDAAMGQQHAFKPSEIPFCFSGRRVPLAV